MLQQAFMRLLQSNVRLDSQQQAGLLPETLEADGGRLAAARDDSDRVALIATLCVLMRQVSHRSGPLLFSFPTAHPALHWIESETLSARQARLKM